MVGIFSFTINTTYDDTASGGSRLSLLGYSSWEQYFLDIWALDCSLFQYLYSIAGVGEGAADSYFLPRWNGLFFSLANTKRWIQGLANAISSIIILGILFIFPDHSRYSYQ